MKKHVNYRNTGSDFNGRVFIDQFGSDTIYNYGDADYFMVKAGKRIFNGRKIWNRQDDCENVLVYRNILYLLGFVQSNDIDVTGHHGNSMYATDAWL